MQLSLLQWARIGLALVVALVAWLFMNATNGQTVNTVLVFRTNPTADVHLHGFYPPSKYTKLKFNEGKTIQAADASALLSENKPLLVNVVNSATLSLYAPLSDGAFCLKYVALCKGTQGKVRALLISDPQSSVVTTSFSRVTRSATRLERVSRFDVDPAKHQKLFVVSFKKHSDQNIFALSRGGPSHFKVDLSQQTEPNEHLRPYVFAASILLAGLFLLITDWRCWMFIRNTFSSSPFATMALISWAALCYTAVFPGVFSVDIVLRYVNDEHFKGWYGSLYYAYTAILHALGAHWIQAPAVLAFLISFAFLLRGISLVFSPARQWTARILKTVLVGTIIFNPGMFAAMFVAQRYFLVLPVLFLGLTMLSWNYLQNFVHKRAETIPGYLSGLLIVALAAFFRTEYFIFLAAAVAVVGFLTFRERTGRYRQMAFLGLAVICVAGTATAFQVSVYAFHGYKPEIEAAKYLAISAISMGRPYVACNSAVQGRYEELIEELGGKQEYCKRGPESFWWTRGNSNAGHMGATKLREVRTEVIKLIVDNPIPYLQDRLHIGKQLLNQEYWHIHSRYKKRDHVRKFGGTNGLSVHVNHADRFGMLRDNPITEPLNRLIPSFYRRLSRGAAGTNAVALIFILIASLPLVIMWRAYATGVLSLMFVALLLPITGLAPTVNSAYIAFLPIWAVYLVPMAACEGAMRRGWIIR